MGNHKSGGRKHDGVKELPNAPFPDSPYLGTSATQETFPNTYKKLLWRNTKTTTFAPVFYKSLIWLRQREGMPESDLFRTYNQSMFLSAFRRTLESTNYHNLNYHHGAAMPPPKILGYNDYDNEQNIFT